jgi:hypothetical protein
VSSVASTIFWRIRGEFHRHGTVAPGQDKYGSGLRDRPIGLKRLGGGHATRGQVVAAQRNIKAAIALLDWLTVRDLTLASVSRATWRKDWPAPSQLNRPRGNVVRWARWHKLARLDFAAVWRPGRLG